jgi:hypothetical protein
MTRNQLIVIMIHWSLRVAIFSLLQHTKWPQNIPNHHKIYQNILNDLKIDQMTIKLTNIFHFKTLPNLSKLEFLVWKYTIWQPCEVYLSQELKSTAQFIDDTTHKTLFETLFMYTPS